MPSSSNAARQDAPREDAGQFERALELLLEPGHEEMDLEQIQRLLAHAVRLYAERAIDARNQGDELPRPFPQGDVLSATEAMVATTAILKAVNVQLFELGMFQSWAGR